MAKFRVGKSGKATTVSGQAAVSDVTNKREAQETELKARDNAYSTLNAAKPNLKSLGFVGRDAANPQGGMASQLTKQIGKASSISNNPMHGLAMTRIGDELMTRIGHAVAGSESDAEALATSHAHIDNARADIAAHQAAHGAGNTKAALGYLHRAGMHLSSAVNSMPEGSKEILKDSWTPAQKTPWRVPTTEKDITGSGSVKQEAADFVSLANAHRDINNIVGAYHDHVKDMTGSLPEGMERPKKVSNTTNLDLSRPVIATPLRSYVHESKHRDIAAKGMEDAMKERIQQMAEDAVASASELGGSSSAKLGEHFNAGAKHGRS
jgi:hypothetical protein